MEIGMNLLDYAALRERGIRYTKTHLWRLWTSGQFPKPTKIEDVKAVLDLLVTLGVLHAPTTPGGPYLRAFDIDAPRVPEFGDQKSTAPIAESLTFHPQREFAQHYMELAGKLLPWIDARTSPFTRADLFADKQAMALVGNPKTDEELRPMLDLLVKYGVLSSKPDGKFQPMRAGAALSTERFDKATKDIADPAHTAAKPRFNYPQPIHDLTTAPRSTWNLSGHDDIPEPGGKTRQVSFKDRATAADKATQEIADLEQQLKAAPSGPGKEALTKKLEEQKRILDANTKHWQFAPAVSKLLDALRKLTDSSSDSNVKGWVAATYSGHQWEEYSADMNLGARSGPWPEAAVIEFFTKLDQAAVTEGMAWRAIYDPDDVRAEGRGDLGGAHRAEGARGRHPPAPRHAAALGGRDHRPHQGQLPVARRVPGDLED